MLFHKAKGLPLEERIRLYSEPEPNSGCWLWSAAVGGTYGQLWWAGRVRYAHVLSYQAFRGAYADGLEIDHLCRNRVCVNPDHLEPVTPQVNRLRGVGVSAINAKKTHCPRGHALAGTNLERSKALRGLRICRLCRHVAHKEKKVS